MYSLVLWLDKNGHDIQKNFIWNKPCLWSNQELCADITLPHHLCLEEWWGQENRVWHPLFGFYMQMLLPSPYDSLCAWFRLNANLNCCLKQCVLCSKTCRARVQSKLYVELSYPLALFNSVHTLCWKTCQNCLQLLVWQIISFYSTVQILFFCNRQSLFREVQRALKVWKHV